MYFVKLFLTDFNGIPSCVRRQVQTCLILYEKLRSLISRALMRSSFLTVSREPGNHLESGYLLARSPTDLESSLIDFVLKSVTLKAMT